MQMFRYKSASSYTSAGVLNNLSIGPPMISITTVMPSPISVYIENVVPIAFRSSSVRFAP